MSARIVRLLLCCTLLVAVLGSATIIQRVPSRTPETAGTYLVQAGSSEAAAAAVAQAGGTVKQPLALIDAVSAELSPAAAAELKAATGVTLYADNPVWRSGGPPDSKETDTAGYALHPAAATRANTLHEQKVSTPKSECKALGINDWGVVQSPGTEQRPLQGGGVTVAVVDSGFIQFASSGDWKRNHATGELFAANSGRCIVYRDFLPRNAANANSGGMAVNSVDQNGHGTHVVATIVDNRATPLAAGANASPVGVAPQVNMVVARALDANGAGTYSSVIASIDWIVQNKQRYNIRVLNLSLYAPVTGPYWADPLNQAVMRAWQSGLVVVAAAGNDGDQAGTITVPGNVPYVITVGAIKSGRYTTSGYDELAAYSSRGPTESAFVKPDVLVPASRTIAPMPVNSTLATELRKLRDANKSSCTIDGKKVAPDKAITGATPAYCYANTALVDLKVGAPAQQHAYYQLSGTSMAAAEVSGVAALILQANPTLSNNQVKYRLLATAKPATDLATGESIYSPWEQGAGLIDADQAVFTTTLETANLGMDIALDLNPAGDVHYWGNTVWDEATGEFRLIDPLTNEQVAVWNGSHRIWAGSHWIWAGSHRIWAGSHRIWAGSHRIWAGGTATWASKESLWAGSHRIWVGTTPNPSLNTATYGESLISE